MEKFSVTRRLTIEAGHRVLLHESKCRNLHGHRYEIFCTVEGPLCESGSSTGMVIDFSELKKLMVEFIEANCDHAMIAWVEDVDLITAYFGEDYAGEFVHPYEEIKSRVKKNGAYSHANNPLGKTYFIAEVPTAENLARHWYGLLATRVAIRMPGATLTKVKVYETENCFAEYPV